MVDKTAMSVSAVRSLSKSAQEWTASTLSRTVSKCRSTELSPATTDAARNVESGELVAHSNDGAANEGEEIPQQDCASEALSKAPDDREDTAVVSDLTAVLKEGESTQLQELAEQAATEIIVLSRKAEGAGIIILDTGAEPRKDKAESIAELPLKLKRARSKKIRREISTCVRGKAASKAAIAVLAAVGAFFAAKRAELGKQIAAAMSFGVVIRRLGRNGIKLYARYFFSAMASYLLDPLHSYLFVGAPKRLSFRLIPGLQKALEDAERQENSHEESQGTPSASSVFPSPLLPSPSSPPYSQIPPLLPAAEIDSPSMLIRPRVSPEADSGRSSPSTTLRRKLLLKLKSRFVKSLHLSKVAPGDHHTPPLYCSSSPGTPTALPSRNKHFIAGPAGSPTLSATAVEMENSDSDAAASSTRLVSQLQDTALFTPRESRG